MNLKLDHIAILSRSLAAVESGIPDKLARHEVETFGDEGTKEQYIDLANSDEVSLLLLEAIGDGPYQRALEKRGAGLHHFGCVTDDLDAAIDHFSNHGLLLHSVSLKTITRNTVWMCRPGLPFLIELSEKKEPVVPPSSLVEAAIPDLPGRKIQWIPGLTLIRSETNEVRITSESPLIRIATEPNKTLHPTESDLDREP